ncbi:MAG: transporter, partial [Gemmataceae bacterium]|nr:transporter [Gemmataceae bacterium]
MPRASEEPLASDRPDFTEASSTVGKGRVQLEGGYTFTRDHSGEVATTSHSYPEALLRIGMI